MPHALQLSIFPLAISTKETLAEELYAICQPSSFLIFYAEPLKYILLIETTLFCVFIIKLNILRININEQCQRWVQNRKQFSFKMCHLKSFWNSIVKLFDECLNDEKLEKKSAFLSWKKQFCDSIGCAQNLLKFSLNFQP
jgi:hypothetical protein